MTNALASCASANVYGPGRTSCVLAVAGGPRPRRRTSRPGRRRGASPRPCRSSGETDEQLAARRLVRGRPARPRPPTARSSRLLRRRRVVAAEPHQDEALTAAWATVSRSAKPSIRVTSEPGRAQDEHGRVLAGRRTGRSATRRRPCARRRWTNELPACSAPALSLAHRRALDLRARVVDRHDDDVVGCERAADGSRKPIRGRRRLGRGFRLRLRVRSRLAPCAPSPSAGADALRIVRLP